MPNALYYRGLKLGNLTDEEFERLKQLDQIKQIDRLNEEDRLKEVDRLKEAGKKIDQQLVDWKPADTNWGWLPSDKVAKDITGDWAAAAQLNDVWHLSRMLIQQTSPGLYDVLFWASSKNDQWILERKGRYTSGIFVLDQPVMDTMNRTYDVIYADRFQDNSLMPKFSYVDYWKKGKSRSTNYHEWVRLNSFQRMPGDSNANE